MYRVLVSRLHFCSVVFAETGATSVLLPCHLELCTYFIMTDEVQIKTETNGVYSGAASVPVRCHYII